MGKFSKNISPSSFSLGVAERIAVITLKKQAKGKIKACRDTVDYIMAYIVRGATTFDPTKKMKFHSYLINKAKFAIKHLITLKKKQRNNSMKHLSLDKSLGYDGNREFSGKDLIKSTGASVEEKVISNEILDYIRNSSYFVPRQKLILLGVFEDNKSVSQLAEELDIHRSYADVLYTKGIEKLRWKFNEGK